MLSIKNTDCTSKDLDSVLCHSVTLLFWTDTLFAFATPFSSVKLRLWYLFFSNCFQCFVNSLAIVWRRVHQQFF